MNNIAVGVEKFPQTHIWIDTCAQEAMEFSIASGACGGTTNPVIVGQVLKAEMSLWEDTIAEMFRSGEYKTEDDVAWALIEKIAVTRSKLLLPAFEKSGGKCGRLSMQTNIKNYRDSDAITAQALHFGTLYPNLNVKVPAGKDGIAAIEEITYGGVSVNATVSFSVAQAVAVAEAVERGLARREKDGLSNEMMAPVCTIMIGRVDDWLKKAVSRSKLLVDPECLEWGGVAVFKKAYGIFKQRGYRTRLLTAAYRNHYHWSALLGGDVSMTIPYNWMQVFANSTIELKDSMDTPVNPAYMEQLLSLDEFRKVYDEDGMTIENFEHYGAFVDCLKGFFKGYEDLLATIRPFQFWEV